MNRYVDDCFNCRHKKVVGYGFFLDKKHDNSMQDIP